MGLSVSMATQTAKLEVHVWLRRSKAISVCFDGLLICYIAGVASIICIRAFSELVMTQA